MLRIICGIRYQILNLHDKRCVHKMIFDTDYMYFRQEESSETVDISFRYSNDKFGIDREFNFCRNVTENVNVCATRMGANLEKAFSKKIKKKKKSVETETFTLPEFEVKFYKNDQILSEETCKDVIDNRECITVCVIDKNYKIIFNPPWINTLQLPTSILAQFPTYPSKLETQFLAPNECKFLWYKGLYEPNKDKQEHVKWISIGEGFIINTTNDEIGYKLKVICEAKNCELVGPKAESISAKNVEAGPGHCPFDTRHLYTKEKLSGNRLEGIGIYG